MSLTPSFGGHRDSVGEAEVPIIGRKEVDQGGGVLDSRLGCGNGPAAMALLSLSRTQIYELIPSPLRC